MKYRRLETNKPCDICGCQAMEYHEYFPKTKANLERYGDLIFDDFNCVPLCRPCHINAGHYTEYQFVVIAISLKKTFKIPNKINSNIAEYIDDIRKKGIIMINDKLEVIYA
jgi:hypothetical protein